MHAKATPRLAEGGSGTPSMGTDLPCHSSVCARDQRGDLHQQHCQPAERHAASVRALGACNGLAVPACRGADLSTGHRHRCTSQAGHHLPVSGGVLPALAVAPSSYILPAKWTGPERVARISNAPRIRGVGTLPAAQRISNKVCCHERCSVGRPLGGVRGELRFSHVFLRSKRRP